MSQLNLEGATKEEVAIARLREFEPPAGYYGTTSYGKDSQAVYLLTKLAGVKVDWHSYITGCEPPELVQFGRENFPDVIRARQGESIWTSVIVNGLPTRRFRWCCRLLKEQGGQGRLVLTGVRWQESRARRDRRMYEVCRKDGQKFFLHPIIDWTEAEVWGFLASMNAPHCSLYDEGYKRLGCVLCPMVGGKEAAKEARRWPKIADAWHRAAIRSWERQTKGMQKFPSGEAYWQWWLSRKGGQDKAQCVMFE